MTQTQNDWVPEVRSLCCRLLDAGFELVKCDNGEDVSQFSGRLGEFIEELIACDDARLYVKCPSDGKIRWLYLVLGNSPGELISDYICDDGIDCVADAHGNAWEGKPQPTKQVEI